MARLCVNIDHVATVRQARRAVEPDPVYAALIADACPGVSGITLHVREDRRHVQDRDLLLLMDLVQGKINLELAPVAEVLALAVRAKPNQATLVPERREEITTEGGLDVVTHFDLVGKSVQQLQDAGIVVSLFIDPSTGQIDAAKRTGAQAIELNTAAYSESATDVERGERLEEIRKAARIAHSEGLVTHAGHGLTTRNVAPIAGIDLLEELNIGHGIVARSIFVGFERAVTEMVELIERASSPPKNNA